ncbi:MAG: hypothetical protein H6851_02875 [Geminicoccaceae bacterium]|nr:hypothetical protein [Geminicoccaceae bacterium]
MLRLEPAWNDPLWQALDAMPLEVDDRPLSFIRRLAHENNWSQNHAKAVIGEYKRFIYLAMRAPHPVTPSQDVDQAWHLHLTYSRNYWEEMCAAILGRPLHHEPTRGGDNEKRRFDEQYKRTLASYERAFEEEPPRALWPLPEDRFRHGGDLVQVHRSRYWLIPRPGRALAAGIGLGLFGVMATISTVHAENISESGESWLSTKTMLIIALGAAGLRLLWQAVVGRSGDGSGGCGAGAGFFGSDDDGCGSGCGGE